MDGVCRLYRIFGDGVRWMNIRYCYIPRRTHSILLNVWRLSPRLFFLSFFATLNATIYLAPPLIAHQFLPTDINQHMRMRCWCALEIVVLCVCNGIGRTTEWPSFAYQLLGLFSLLFFIVWLPLIVLVRRGNYSPAFFFSFGCFVDFALYWRHIRAPVHIIHGVTSACGLSVTLRLVFQFSPAFDWRLWPLLWWHCAFIHTVQYRVSVVCCGTTFTSSYQRLQCGYGVECATSVCLYGSVYVFCCFIRVEYGD